MNEENNNINQVTPPMEPQVNINNQTPEVVVQPEPIQVIEPTPVVEIKQEEPVVAEVQPVVEPVPTVQEVPVTPEVQNEEATPVVETNTIQETPVVETIPVVEPVSTENTTTSEVQNQEVTPVVEKNANQETPELTPTVESTPMINPQTPSVPTPPEVPTTTVATEPVKSKGIPTGAIIGAVVGIVVLIAVLVVVFVVKPFGSVSGPQGVAEKYIYNLIQKKYQDNFSLVSMPENSFVSEADYVEFIQKKQIYSDLVGMEIDKVEELLKTEESSKYNVVLVNEDEQTKELPISLVSSNGDWKVVEDSFYITDWSIVVPKGTKVLIDNKEVPESLMSNDSSNLNNVRYTIPAITSTKKTIQLNNPLQSKSYEETPLLSNKDKKYTLELENQELITKAYDYVKDTWNQIYASYVAKENVSDVASKYFDSSVDINNVDTYYTKSLTELVDDNYKDFNMLEVVSGKTPNYVLTNELIQLNFGYKLSWIYDPTYSSKDSLKTMTRYSKIVLKYDGTTFKIYDVQDEKLFSYANYFTNNY